MGAYGGLELLWVDLGRWIVHVEIPLCSGSGDKAWRY